jgi:hypothetical protein
MLTYREDANILAAGYHFVLRSKMLCAILTDSLIEENIQICGGHPSSTLGRTDSAHNFHTAIST